MWKQASRALENRQIDITTTYNDIGVEKEWAAWTENVIVANSAI